MDYVLVRLFGFEANKTGSMSASFHNLYGEDNEHCSIPFSLEKSSDPHMILYDTRNINKSHKAVRYLLKKNQSDAPTDEPPHTSDENMHGKTSSVNSCSDSSGNDLNQDPTNESDIPATHHEPSMLDRGRLLIKSLKPLGLQNEGKFGVLNDCDRIVQSPHRERLSDEGNLVTLANTYEYLKKDFSDLYDRIPDIFPKRRLSNR